MAIFENSDFHNNLIIMGVLTTGLFSSNSELWETPQKLFDCLDREFHFTLDPCATKENAKCALFFTEKEDGLKQNWGGYNVFCNPPYGNKISRWVKKCYEESRKKNTIVVMLIPARTDTSYFHDYIYGKAEVRFIRRRLRFSDSKASAPFPSMVVVFGGKPMWSTRYDGKDFI